MPYSYYTCVLRTTKLTYIERPLSLSSFSRIPHTDFLSLWQGERIIYGPGSDLTRLWKDPEMRVHCGGAVERLDKTAD